MNLEGLVLHLFAGSALVGGILMLVARHPMRVALALIVTMLSLAGIYAALGVHVIAVFQVLIYVGAVMVFMVYVIMLLDVRDPSFVKRYAPAIAPGLIVGALLAGALALAVREGASGLLPAAGADDARYLVRPFSAEFLRSYWLHFELASVLLVAAVVAAVAVIKGRRRNDG